MHRKLDRKICDALFKIAKQIIKILQWTLLVFVKDQSSHLVYLNICIKYQTCENLRSIGHRSWEKMMKEKTPLLDEFVCFQIGIKEF